MLQEAEAHGCHQVTWQRCPGYGRCCTHPQQAWNPEICSAIILLPLASREVDEASLACGDEGAGEPVTTGRESRLGKLLLEEPWSPVLLLSPDSQAAHHGHGYAGGAEQAASEPGDTTCGDNGCQVTDADGKACPHL